MAALIELSTPERLKAKGLEFKDWTLDAESIQSNCRAIAATLAKENIFKNIGGRQVDLSPADVFETSKHTIIELGKIVSGHDAYMRELGAGKP